MGKILNESGGFYFPNTHYVKRSGNFIRIGVAQIFIGYTEEQWMGDSEIIHKINPNIPAKFHFFLHSEYDMNDAFFKDLKYILAEFNPAVKIIIHFPYDLKHLLEVFHGKCDINDKRLTAFAERKFPEFVHPVGRIYESSSCDKRIESALRIVSDKGRFRAEFIEYECSKSYVVGGAILNSEEARHPEKYKKDIIGRFKAITPLGILKSFKDEDDIWDYITLDKEWSINNAKVGIKAKDLGLNPNSTQKDYENALGSALNQLFGIDKS